VKIKNISSRAEQTAGRIAFPERVHRKSVLKINPEA
jgi:hypothetical protein